MAPILQRHKNQSDESMKRLIRVSKEFSQFFSWFELHSTAYRTEMIQLLREENNRIIREDNICTSCEG